MSDDRVLHWEKLHNDYLKHRDDLGLSRLVVSAVICVQDKILIVRRATHDSYPGMWEYPGGGVDSEKDETVLVALRREVLEETGISLPEFPTSEILKHPTRTAIRVVLRFDMEHFPEVTLSDEHDNYLFVSLDEAKTARDDNGFILDSMREENQAILHLIFNTPVS